MFKLSYKYYKSYLSYMLYSRLSLIILVLRFIIFSFERIDSGKSLEVDVILDDHDVTDLEGKSQVSIG